MIGADLLVRSLLAGGIDTCFGNPGTSEMHFVSALDRIEGMRSILTLFEGVATGAADGYARMAGRPACTLMHLGPGLANGLCNLHNARRAGMPVVNIVGDHARHHRGNEAPLESDVEAVARTFSHWVRTAQSAGALARDCAAAIDAASEPPGRIASLILPADTAWSDAGDAPPGSSQPRPARPSADRDRIAAAAALLRGTDGVGLMIGGEALQERGLHLAGRLAAATGCRIFAPMSNARISRGAGRPPIERTPFPIDEAVGFLRGLRHILTIGARPPVAFFAYPDKPTHLAPPGCGLHMVASAEEDGIAALADLVDACEARAQPVLAAYSRPEAPRGPLTAASLGAALAADLPEQAVVIDEALSLGFTLYPALAQAPPHEWLQMTGGATGEGLPLAVGAAVAAPDRKVVCLQGDGSGLYTCQALWTMAREGLDVTVVVLSNRSYASLVTELHKVGATAPGPRGLGMIRLDDPAIGWSDLARGFGVPASRAEDCDQFADAYRRALAAPGPKLIEAVISPG